MGHEGNGGMEVAWRWRGMAGHGTARKGFQQECRRMLLSSHMQGLAESLPAVLSR